eukprot:708825-Rhodomonas_salina.1
MKAHADRHRRWRWSRAVHTASTRDTPGDLVPLQQRLAHARGSIAGRQRLVDRHRICASIASTASAAAHRVPADAG